MWKFWYDREHTESPTNDIKGDKEPNTHGPNHKGRSSYHLGVPLNPYLVLWFEREKNYIDRNGCKAINIRGESWTKNLLGWSSLEQ